MHHMNLVWTCKITQRLCGEICLAAVSVCLLLQTGCIVGAAVYSGNQGAKLHSLQTPLHGLPLHSLGHTCWCTVKSSRRSVANNMWYTGHTFYLRLAYMSMCYARAFGSAQQKGRKYPEQGEFPSCVPFTQDLFQSPLHCRLQSSTGPT